MDKNKETRIKEFEWDRFNAEKIQNKHNVGTYECEEIFLNEYLKILPDETHSITEFRYYAYGNTDAGRLLFIVFTIRINKIRVIFARDMNRKERKWYYEEIKKDT